MKARELIAAILASDIDLDEQIWIESNDRNTVGIDLSVETYCGYGDKTKADQAGVIVIGHSARTIIQDLADEDGLDVEIRDDEVTT